MKDLDFDELDRAVNSLLTTNSNPVSSEPVESSPVASPAPEPEAVVAEDPAVVPAAPLAARRSSGRFMDVVHPSSDMRTTVVPSRPVSREGVGIAPLATSEQDATGVLPSQIPSDTATQANVTVPSSETPASVANEWPDPLDFNGFAQNDPIADTTEEPPKEEQPQPEQSTSMSDDQDGDINQITDDINKTLGVQNDTPSPLESPFLTDAKVEKRPLGAFSEEPPAAPATTVQTPEPVQPVEPSTFTPTAPDEPQPDQKPIELVTPLPAELGEDLLSIESDTDTTGKPKKEMTPIPPTSQPEITAGPASIPQQYTEQPSTGDQPAGTIFDTGEYQKPLSHPAKKKSGWLMLLWIVLLLAVGAGAGAAVYFFILPML